MPRLMHHALVVVRTDLASPFRDRFSFDRSVRVFAAADASEVLAKIQKQAPLCLALDRKFVTSPAGAQFVTELRSAHPDFEVRILTDEGGDIPLVLRRPVQETGLKTVEACSEPL